MYVIISQLVIVLLLCLFQLLDCFVIPVLMVLSWFFLKTRYRLVHFVAVLVCLLGVGAMVGADIVAGRGQESSKDTFIIYICKVDHNTN